MQYTPRRLRLEKQRRHKTYKGKALRIFLVILIAFGMWFLLRQVHGLIRISMAKTISVEEGVLEKTFPTQAVITRYEQVYTCPISGELQIIAKEEERVGEGTLIAVVKGEGSSVTTDMPVKNIYAKRAGIVSYKLDGLENVLTPETITHLRSESIFNQAKTASCEVVANQKILSSGMGFVKIVNNLKPIVMDFILPHEAFDETPQAGDILTFCLKEQSEQGTVKATQITRSSNGYRIIAETTDWTQKFLSERLLDLEFVIATYRGVIVPQTALSEKEGEQGVYKTTSGRYRFEPIEIIGQVGELLIVTGIEAGEEILVEGSVPK
jgi:putative membrane fusion protein